MRFHEIQGQQIKYVCLDLGNDLNRWSHILFEVYTFFLKNPVAGKKPMVSPGRNLVNKKRNKIDRLTENP